VHTTSQTKNKVDDGVLLDVVVGQGAAILQLLACRYEPLLVWW
jgi:hypothetical protein